MSFAKLIFGLLVWLLLIFFSRLFFNNPVFFVLRRLFHVCTFFLFFFNIFLGVVSCLKRIFIGAILGVMFLGRTQKSVLSRDFELKDPGLCKMFCSLSQKKYRLLIIVLMVVFSSNHLLYLQTIMQFRINTQHQSLKRLTICTLCKVYKFNPN